MLPYMRSQWESKDLEAEAIITHHKYEHAPRRPWRKRGKDGRKEDRNKEAEGGRHGRDARLATFGNASTRLDEAVW
jgi:hypothetical protein